MMILSVIIISLVMFVISVPLQRAFQKQNNGKWDDCIFVAFFSTFSTAVVMIVFAMMGISVVPDVKGRIHVSEINNVKYFDCGHPIKLTAFNTLDGHEHRHEFIASKGSHEFYYRLPKNSPTQPYDPPRTFIITERDGRLLSIYPKE